MAQEYNHLSIEKKWREKWAKEKIYKTTELGDKPKAYILDMFPYPSGVGLHVGHPKGYIATDIYSRFKHMNGFNVLHPMGWDAFGLPAEEYAIKNKIHPRVAVEQNIKRYKEQLEILGFNYDWEREIDTTDPKYYKWTQWIFLQMFKDGLAFESHEPINWCPSCKTGLANEDLEGGKCERCGSIVEKRPIRQWVLKITDYAEDLLADLKDLAWPESIKESQRNWIGKSEGAEFDFELVDIPGQPDGKHKVKVFTTRPDTLFGATFVAISAARAKLWLDIGWKASEEIKKFIEKTLAKEAVRALNEVPEKEGMFTGIYAKNPANREKIPVWIANYVLSDYGSGVIMAVPAHDERDFEFAKKFSIEIRPVVLSGGSVQIGWTMEKYAEEWNDHYAKNGKLWNSGEFTGMESEEAKKEIIKFAKGKEKIQYKLKDWVFSRQRYWGEPIPLIHCKKCGVVPVPEKDLPVELPDVKYYEPTGTGESPLANISEWVNVKCPKCGGEAKRETNTMPQWAGSCWYYLRYMDPKNDKALVDPKKEKHWAPVDMYVGGTEHATRHLIYARFWHKFLYKIGAVSTKEPFIALRNQGLIMGTDGRKMSKRFGNVVNPDDIVAQFGADTMRVYEMFMGPFEASISWSTDNLVGSRRFVERVWNLAQKVSKEGTVSDETLFNRTVKQVTEDIENFRFNTVISDMMILLNSLEKEEKIPQAIFETFITLLSPVAPHITEELWQALGYQTSIHLQPWPTFDVAKLVSETATIAVQVNGKIRGECTVSNTATEDEIKTQALSLESVKKWTEGKEIKKTIFIKGKLISFVV
ncbi:MAG: leucine--tRNA ligase [Patescibacteria group bacterium]|nr:leucine--tRNA ligase [bacterium]MDZ4240953.1 leucine--tRNA ligase [Patescibacteria group bacterium]